MTVFGSGDAKVTVTLESGGTAADYSVTLEAGNHSKIYCMLGAPAGITEIAGMIVTVEESRPGGISSMKLYDLYAENSSATDRLERFSSSAPEADGAVLSYDGTDALLTCESATPAFFARLAKPVTGGSSTETVRAVITSPCTGSISFSITGDGKSAASVIASYELQSGTHSYIFTFERSRVCTVYRIAFSSLAVTDAVLRIHSVIFYDCFSDTVISDAAPSGVISSCRMTDTGAVAVSGTVSDSAVIKYTGAKLCLFEIPVWSDAAKVMADAPSVSVRISTKFEIMLDADEQKYPPSLCSYLAAITYTGDGESVTVPLAEPVSVSYNIQNGLVFASPLGLYGCEATGAFEAGVSHVMADTDITALARNSSGSQRIASIDGKPCYIGNEYLASLDREIGFYVSAGINVYLRLYNDSDSKSLDIDITDADEAYFLEAVITFLSERYSGISGFAVGSALNITGDTTSPAPVSLYEAETELSGYALREAAILRIIYASAVADIENINVISIFSSDGAVSPSDMLYGKAGNHYDNALLASLISVSLSGKGAVNWGIMYEGDITNSPEAAAEHIFSVLYNTSGITPSAMMLLLRHSGASFEDTATTLGRLCIDSTYDNFRAVILSLDDSTHDYNLYRQIKVISSSRIYSASAQAADLSAMTGSFDIWNFADAYDTLGWVAGGGCSLPVTRSNSCLSESGGIKSPRTLSVGITGSGAASLKSGTLLCLTDTPYPLSLAPFVEYVFCIDSATAQSGDTASVTFIFGSSDRRAEYTASVNFGVPQSIVCDLSGFTQASAVEYCAVIVSSGTDATLDISRISAHSNVLTSDELASMLKPADAGDTTDSNVLYFYVAAVAAASLVIFALLSRKHEKHGDNTEN